MTSLVECKGRMFKRGGGTSLFGRKGWKVCADIDVFAFLHESLSVVSSVSMHAFTHKSIHS